MRSVTWRFDLSNVRIRSCGVGLSAPIDVQIVSMWTVGQSVVEPGRWGRDNRCLPQLCFLVITLYNAEGPCGTDSPAPIECSYTKETGQGKNPAVHPLHPFHRYCPCHGLEGAVNPHNLFSCPLQQRQPRKTWRII